MIENTFIVFDMDEVLNVLEPIEQNYCDFLELSESFLGWLLTLNDQEFELVHRSMNHDFKNDPEGATSFLFPIIALRHQGKTGVLYQELVYLNNQKKGKVNMVKLIKEGLLTYKTSEKDVDWEFELTEKGAKYKKDTEAKLEKENDGKAD